MQTTFGPYVPSRVLAQGGMSVVYVARHRDTGDEVALKTVRVPNEIYLASLRREVHALARLQHPGVVRVLEDGVLHTETGVAPWFAMQLLVGETLADVSAQLRARGDGRVAAAGSLPRVLTIARRLCSTLAFLHGEGVVHGDLKPQNVFVRPGDRPVMVDFGLAGRFGMEREVAELGHVAFGTPAYMAPEQIRGDAVDPRTDLYALGCVLYELVTGAPPFTGNDVLQRHLTTEPTPASRRVAAVPPALDELLLALLAKRPRDRVGHAGDVARALEALGAMPDPEAHAEPRAYVYRPELAGRDALVRDVLGRLVAARDRRGALVLLGGESGIGKTYLATEIARRARRELHVVASTCDGGGALQPFRELFAAIADRCAPMGEEATERILGPRAAVLAPYAPQLAKGDDHVQSRENVIAALRETLGAFAEEQPLLLLLDDVHEADELTLGLLESLNERFFADHPIAILATHRTDVRSRALALSARPHVVAREVEPLDGAAVRAVIADMLGEKAPNEQLVSSIVERGRGNPFFIAELLRAAISSREEAPPTLREIVRLRLDALSPAARVVCDVACVLGREVDLEVLRRATRLDDAALLAACNELVARQIVEARGARLVFAHERLREIAYETLAASTRRALHRDVAVALEDCDDRDGSTAAIAHHWEAAGVDDKALEWLERAALRARREAAYAQAEGLYRRALELADGDARTTIEMRARLRAGLASAAFARGELHEAERHYLAVLELLGKPLSRSRIARAAFIARESSRQLAHVVGLRRRNAESRTADLAIEAATALTHKYFYDDDAEGLLASALLAVNLAERSGSSLCSAQVPHAYAVLGYAAGMLGSDELAARYFSLARQGTPREPAARAHRHGVESVHHANRGRWDEAMRCIDRAEAEVAGAYDPFTRGMILMQRGNIEFYTGRAAEARGLYEEMLRVSRERGNEQHATWALVAMGRSDVALRRFRDAVAPLEEARAALAIRPELQAEIICNGLLAQAYAELGDDRAARLAIDAASLRMARARPTGFAGLAGYVGVLEALFAIDADDSEIERTLTTLARFSRAMPMARSAVARFRGMLAARTDRAAARRALADALDLADRHHMPLARAAAERALARLDQGEHMRGVSQ